MSSKVGIRSYVGENIGVIACKLVNVGVSFSYSKVSNVLTVDSNDVKFVCSIVKSADLLPRVGISFNGVDYSEDGEVIK